MGQLLPYSFAPLKPLGFTGTAVSTTDPVTPTLPSGAQGALIQATGGNLNWTNDGTAPTSAAGGGMVLVADAEPQWLGNADIATAQFIAADADTFLLISFYG